MSPVLESQLNWGNGLRGKSRWASYEYDFTLEGGTVAAHTLRGTALPSGAVVLDAVIKTITPPTSGGLATVAVKIEGGADIQAAVAFDASPFAAAGAKHGSAIDRSKAPIVLTAARSVVMTVAVAALTAGKFVVLVEYVNVRD